MRERLLRHANTPRYVKHVILWRLCIVLVAFSHGAAFGLEGIHYSVEIKGVGERSLREDLKSISKSIELKSHPPPTIDFLSMRVRDDVGRFLELLRSRGYYDARVDSGISEHKQPVEVIFRINTGRVYPLRAVEINFTENKAELKPRFPSLKELGIETNVPAQTGTILNDQKAILGEMGKMGYPFSKIAQRQIVVDHKARDVKVTFEMDSGPLGRFGPTKIVGLKDVREDFVRSKIPWKEGDRFDGGLIDELKNRLIATRLFSLVAIKHAEELAEDGLLPIYVELTEHKPRSLSFGLNYATDQGFGGKFSWENRNLWHGGEDLKIAITAAQIGVGIDSSFEKPDFLSNEQSLISSFRVGRDETDAYTSRNTEGSVLLDRHFGKSIKAGAGLGFRLSRVEQFGETQDYVLISAPSHFDWDTSNNLLDPTSGGRLFLRLNPYYDVLAGDQGFVKSYAVYTHYVELSDRPRIVLAGRVAAGSIAGSDVAGAPADLRFYAGGGGSIRGYPYQKVGPLRDGEPIGGRSVFEISGELRFKVTKTIGFVVFLDGGSAFESTYPDMKEALRWGTGPGLRYYTPIGPVRLDIGFPINRRVGIDDVIQVYVSVGQAF
jgi:translocation and assembly module TamA